MGGVIGFRPLVEQSRRMAYTLDDLLAELDASPDDGALSPEGKEALASLRGRETCVLVGGYERGLDWAPFARLQTVLATPYAEHAGCEDLAALPPEWAQHIEISCSS